MMVSRYIDNFNLECNDAASLFLIVSNLRTMGVSFYFISVKSEDNEIAALFYVKSEYNDDISDFFESHYVVR